MTKKKKKVAAAVAVSSLAAALVAGGIMAYFTDGDTVTNTFTVGKVSMDLKEPNFDEDDAKEFVPNQEYEKDPQTTNTGINDMYTYMEVLVPFANVVRVNEDGTTEHATETELFKYSVNAPTAEKAGWVELTYSNGITKSTSDTSEQAAFIGFKDNIKDQSKTVNDIVYGTSNVNTADTADGKTIAQTAYGNGHTITDGATNATGNIISTQAAAQTEDSKPAVSAINAATDASATEAITPVVDAEGNNLYAGYFDYNTYYTVAGVNEAYLDANNIDKTGVEYVSSANADVANVWAKGDDGHWSNDASKAKLADPAVYTEAEQAYKGLVKFKTLEEAQAFTIAHKKDANTAFAATDIVAHGNYFVNGVRFDTAAAAKAYSLQAAAVYGDGAPETQIIQTGIVRHLYAYVEKGNADKHEDATLQRVSANETTTPLFNSVKLINMTEDAGLEKATLELSLNGYSIQSDFLGQNVSTSDLGEDGRAVINKDGDKTAGGVWTILSNQTNSTIENGEYIFKRDQEDTEGHSTDIIDTALTEAGQHDAGDTMTP